MSGLTKAGKEREIIIRMRRIQWGNPMIKSAGYDAQQQMLEIEFASDGQIWQFDNVPEDIWYRFRSFFSIILLWGVIRREKCRRMRRKSQKSQHTKGIQKRGTV